MKSRKWKKISSKVILKTRFFKLFQKAFRRPNGSIIKNYHLIEKPESVHIVAVTQDGKVILIKHYRPGTDEIMTEIPAGTIHNNETPQSACQRELREETGYKADNVLEISCLTQDTSRFTGYSCHLFLAQNLTKVKDQKLNVETKEIEVIEINLQEALQMIEKGQIKDLLTIAGLLLAQQFL